MTCCRSVSGDPDSSRKAAAGQPGALPAGQAGTGPARKAGAAGQAGAGAAGKAGAGKAGAGSARILSPLKHQSGEGSY